MALYVYDLKNGENMPTSKVIRMPVEYSRRAFNRPASQYGESIWGGNHMVDDIAILLGGNGKRCDSCSAVTWFRYLSDGLCVDCRGFLKVDT